MYVSHDYGDTWTSIGSDLPAEPINVVKEDPKNANILYVGTDHGLYVSLDKGKSFMAMDKDLPNVAVHDLMVHPREHELVVGTHGRSLYIANVEHLEKLDSATLNSDLTLFDVKKQRAPETRGREKDLYAETKDPSFSIPLYVRSGGAVRITLKAGKDVVLSQYNKSVVKGVNYVEGDLTYFENVATAYQNWLNSTPKGDKEEDKIVLKKMPKGEKGFLHKGTYTLEVEKEGVKQVKELILE